MTTRCILQMAFLLCVSTKALSKSLNLLQFQQRQSTLACQKLLQTLNGTPEACLEDRMNFKVPKELEQPQPFQKEGAALVIYEMLQQMFGIFRRNVSHTGWNETIVENLLVEFYQQMDRMEPILEENTEKESTGLGNMVNILHLKSYYFRINRYLRAKAYSSCAWTVVRMELLRNLAFISRLTDYL
ncbi:PREDICTED: interferon beta [Elephantulus edwardii]|uniref:interferon beta n=1 Tax=Elephantulus edwardii TaxID=28737 RepID=UPI0003F0796F|nr:PREDICTED: interferon beta [Elephantulus edwardii]